MLVWTALATVYVVWGSTYLGIRVVVETVPPLFASGVRFMTAGALMLGYLVIKRGPQSIRVPRRQLASAAVVGALLPGANAVVSIGEQTVPSNLAALLFASIPLIVLLFRRITGERIAGASYLGIVVGFAGVALLLLSGNRPDGATIGGMLICVAAALMWASGTFAGSRLDMPSSALVSTGWQMLTGGTAVFVASAIAGEWGDVHQPSGDSILAFFYLLVFGSLIAFTAYAWLVRNVPVSKVATYAYVNPAVAIVLGWLILSETITALTLIGAAVIIASVALVVRSESDA